MLRIVPHTVLRVGRSYEHFPDGLAGAVKGWQPLPPLSVPRAHAATLVQFSLRQRDRDSEIETVRQRQTQRQKKRYRDGETETGRQRQRQETERQRDRQKETETEIEVQVLSKAGSRSRLSPSRALTPQSWCDHRL